MLCAFTLKSRETWSLARLSNASGIFSASVFPGAVFLQGKANYHVDGLVMEVPGIVPGNKADRRWALLM